MARSLPPLNALRAFEVVARHLSVTRAAEELHVTHSAVSQQIKLLEQYVGVSLLNRAAGRIGLTDQGRRFAGQLTDIFGQLNRATDRLLHAEAGNVLTIKFISTLAMRWLIPRLPSFQEANPELELRLSTGGWQEVDFNVEQIDMAIYYGDGKWPGLQADFLFHDEVFPVCSPKVMGKHKQLNLEKDMLKYKYIYVNQALRKQDWPRWLKAMKLNKPPKSSRVYFQNSSQALQAAVNGLGIAITHGPFVSDDIEQGNLIVAVEHSVRFDDDYYLVYPKTAANKPKIQRFREWLLGQV